MKKAQLRPAPRAKKLEKLGVYSGLSQGRRAAWPPPAPGPKSRPGRAPSRAPTREDPSPPPGVAPRPRCPGALLLCRSRRRRLPGAERVPGSPSRGLRAPPSVLVPSGRSWVRWGRDPGLGRGAGSGRVPGRCACGRPGAPCFALQPGRCPGSASCKQHSRLSARPDARRRLGAAVSSA